MEARDCLWSEKSPNCVMGSQDNKKQRLPPLQTKACFLRLFGCGNLTKSKCIGAYKLRCLFFLLSKHIHVFGCRISSRNTLIIWFLDLYILQVFRGPQQALHACTTAVCKRTSSRNHSWAWRCVLLWLRMWQLYTFADTTHSYTLQIFIVCIVWICSIM